MAELADAPDLGDDITRNDSMDFWMIDRKHLKDDLLEIFSALDNIQNKYDWIISDADIFYPQLENTPKGIMERWNWNALLISGQEMTDALSNGYVHFVAGGVLSAVPLGTKVEEVNKYVPYWEIENFGSPDYQFQTPLTQLEILCYDGYAWVIICNSDFSETVKKKLPFAMTEDEFYDYLKTSNN